MSYEKIGQEIGKLVEEKQAAYGDSFGKAGAVLRALYPDGVKPEALNDALTVVRVVDKLFRIATKKDAFGESPWRDIAGYSILSVKRDEEARKPPPGNCQTRGMSDVNGKLVQCEGDSGHSGPCWNSRWRKAAAPVVPTEVDDPDPYTLERVGGGKGGAW